MKHDWDTASYFCIGCGIAAQSVVENPDFSFCPANDKLVAISHIVARRRLNALLGLVDDQDVSFR